MLVQDMPIIRTSRIPFRQSFLSNPTDSRRHGEKMEKAGGSRRTRRSRSALLWGLLLFLITQASFSLALDRWQPNLYDPDYSSHLTSLKSRIAEVPDGPLLL